jgi:hypothetical protein
MFALWRNSPPMIGMLVVACMRGLASPGVSIQVFLFNSSLPFACLSSVRLHIASLVCSLCVYCFFALSRNSISIRDLRTFLRTHSCICSPLYDGSSQVMAISHAAYLMGIRISSLLNYLLHVCSLNSYLRTFRLTALLHQVYCNSSPVDRPSTALVHQFVSIRFLCFFFLPHLCINSNFFSQI